MASKAGRPPNYYSILGITETASSSQIRDAYKRAALKTHPDRVPADHPDRAARTRQFQMVNDAYYTLSDASRRRAYDAQRKLFTRDSRRSTGTGSSAGAGAGGAQMPGGFDFEDAFAGGGEGGSGAGGIPFSWAWDFFTGQGQGQGQGQQGQGRQGQEEARARTEDEQFADVFEEMLREEGMAGQEGGGGGAAGKFWGVMGGLSGGALGFIVANVPGLVAGAVAGNRLGAVRDAKGKSVYAVFQELPQTDRARLLSQLAAKVLSHAVGI